MKTEKAELKRDTSIQYLKGVGPRLGQVLAKRGIRQVEDLLTYYPRTYEDRRAARNIGSLNLDDVVSLKARIANVSSYAMGQSKRKIYDILIRDQSGQIHCKFFRVPYRGYFERFQIGQEVRVVGKVIDYRGRLEFHHPDLREITAEEEIEDALLPIYTEIEAVTSTRIRRFIQTAIGQLNDQSFGPEPLPESLRQHYRLIKRTEAIYQIHNPEHERAAEYFSFRSPAHRRLIFEEFFWLELYLAARKAGLEAEQGVPLKGDGKLVSEALAQLPFALTGAQTRVFAQVRQDLAGSRPMHRLVQGDVGSGKTVVAFLAALVAREAGFQATLMAPTEILAEQHFKNASRLLAPLGLRVELLVGKTKSGERKQLLERLLAGEVDLLIGTHALLEDVVQFRQLGLVIIDEQHRFGVEQRAKLKRKGISPHFLVMTATPIPRTLAMTVYGDLDVSTIDEMPPGRSPIQTRVTYESKRPEALNFMLAQLEKGRQAYMVYPLVEESEKIDLKNALDEFEKLKAQYPHIRFGLLHGKMKPEEKEAIMQEFREHRIQVLVSTTVIEVGVDVPNANIMIVEHAERFGLSQLHQLRGRVGRGEHKSFCIFILGKAVSTEAFERTSFLEKNLDGFKIAEFDLELRGPGEFLGTRQSGLPGFQMAHLVRDMEILQEAREAAFALLAKDPTLKLPDHQYLRDQLLKAHGPTALASIG